MKLQEIDSSDISIDQPSDKTEQQTFKSENSRENSVSKKLSGLEFQTFDDQMAVAQKVIKDITSKNPHLITELLAINVSDFMKIFNHLSSRSDNLENAYRKLFLGLEKYGASKFVEESLKEIKDNHLTSSQNAAIMDVWQNLISNHVGDNKEVFDMLGNEKLSHLVKEYLNQVDKIYLIS